MLNFVAIAGRLTKDPELRYTANNTPVCTFSVAVERDRKNAEGNRETDFFSCVAWRQTGEFVKKYFSKGSQIIITGRLSQRTYKDKDGNNRSTLEIISQDVYFGGSKTEKPQSSGFTEIEDDGELPF